MAPSCSSDRPWLRARRTIWEWTRRIAILGSVTVSLALAGQSTTAGSGTPVAFRAETGTSAHRGDTSARGSEEDLAQIRILTDQVRASLGHASGRYVDLASLFLLGLCLVGASHVVARRPARRRRDAQIVQSLHRPGTVVRPYVAARGSSRRAAG